MSISSYSDLQSTVSRFLKRSDLTSLVPDFIMLAETSLNRVLNTTQQRTTFSMTPTSNVVSLPTDLNKLIKVYWNGHPLDYIPESRTATDPSFQMECGYAIQGGNIFLQVPQLGLPLRIDYFRELEVLSNTNTSNWLLEDAPDIYLYATLIQAGLYVRDDDRVALWTQVYSKLLEDLIEDDQNRLIPEDSTLVMRAG